LSGCFRGGSSSGNGGCWSIGRGGCWRRGYASGIAIRRQHIHPILLFASRFQRLAQPPGDFIRSRQGNPRVGPVKSIEVPTLPRRGLVPFAGRIILKGGASRCVSVKLIQEGGWVARAAPVLISSHDGKLVGGAAGGWIHATHVQCRVPGSDAFVQDLLPFSIQCVPIKQPVVQGNGPANVGCWHGVNHYHRG